MYTTKEIRKNAFWKALQNLKKAKKTHKIAEKQNKVDEKITKRAEANGFHEDYKYWIEEYKDLKFETK